MTESTQRISELIEAHREGQSGAFEELVSVLYPELRRLARRQRRRSGPSPTLDTTALLHEAYLKLAPGDRNWRDRGHFLAAVAQAMRHILVDAARRRLTARHGGGHRPETLDEDLGVESGHAADVLAVDEALGGLRQLDERLCKVIECRFFAGMTEEETAAALAVSSRTVHRDWLRARAWLRRKLGRGSAASASDGASGSTK